MNVRIVGAAAIAALCVLGPGQWPAAHAAVAGPPAASLGGQPEPSAAGLALALGEGQWLQAKKEALFAVRADAIRTGNSASYEKALNKLNRDLVGPNAKAVPSVANSSLATPQAASAAATAYFGKVVTVQHRAQEASNWCGPASGVMMVGEANWWFGLGSVPSQSTMRVSMGTGAAGGAGTAIDGFLRGVNGSLGGAYFSLTTNLKSKGAAWYQNAVTGNLDAMWTAGVNTTEPAGKVHYNSHPVSLEVAHYIVAYGYTSYGTTLSYDDPAGGGAGLGWGSASQFSYGTTSFFDSFMNYAYSGRGLVW